MFEVIGPLLAGGGVLLALVVIVPGLVTSSVVHPALDGAGGAFHTAHPLIYRYVPWSGALELVP